MESIFLPKPVSKDYKKMNVSSNAKTAMQDFKNMKNQENMILQMNPIIFWYSTPKRWKSVICMVRIQNNCFKGAQWATRKWRKTIQWNKKNDIWTKWEV